MLGKMNLVRVLAVGAFAVAAPVAVAVAVPATANAGTAKTVTCTAVGGTLKTQKLSGCSGDTSLSSTATATSLGTLLTWTKGGTDTLKIGSDKSLTGSKNTCPKLNGKASTTLVVEAGTVSKGTGAAAALAGGKTAAEVCLYAAGVQLLPHTKFTL